MNVEKGQIRAAMRAARHAVPVAARRAHAEDVCARLSKRSEVTAAIAAHRPVCVYLAGPDEIDLSAFICTVKARGGVLCAPRWDGATYRTALLGADLREGPHGILEPLQDDRAAFAEVAVWVVPGLAFTRAGARLGYGGGWYDRFFAASDPASAKFGVAYPFQVLEALPTEAHDQMLTEVFA